MGLFEPSCRDVYHASSHIQLFAIKSVLVACAVRNRNNDHWPWSWKIFKDIIWKTTDIR